MSEYQYLAVNLRRLRLDARLSQQQLAARAGDGFSQPYVSDLERGRWPVDRAHVSRLATALGVDEATLLRRVRRVTAAA